MSRATGVSTLAKWLHESGFLAGTQYIKGSDELPAIFTRIFAP